VTERQQMPKHNSLNRIGLSISDNFVIDKKYDESNLLSTFQSFDIVAHPVPKTLLKD